MAGPYPGERMTAGRSPDFDYTYEKQRFMVAIGILLSYLTGSRLVSLCDTRVKIDDDPIVEPKADASHSDTDTMGDKWEGYMMLNMDGESDCSKFEKRVPGRSKCRPKCVLEKVAEDMEDSADSDMDYSVLSDVGGDEDSDTDYADSSEDGPDRFSDDSSVTDDEYGAGPEETGAIVWRHIAFYIVRSPVPGRPNILLAKITLLHTKGEDNKPRV